MQSAAAAVAAFFVFGQYLGFCVAQDRGVGAPVPFGAEPGRPTVDQGLAPYSAVRIGTMWEVDFRLITTVPLADLPFARSRSFPLLLPSCANL